MYIRKYEANIEKHIFGNQNLPTFPYAIAKMVAKKLYPLIGSNEKYVVVLCDISLNSFNPGRMFIDILIHMENNKFQPNNIEDIYQYCFGFQSMYRGSNHTLFGLYYELREEASKQLNDYFSEENAANLKMWFKNLLDSGLRLKEVRWVNKILNANSQEAKDYFSKLTNSVGLPLISNNRDNYYCHSPNVDISKNASTLRAIADLMFILKGESKKCSMVNFCNNSLNKITDTRCEIEPWTRVQDELLCPFAFLWNIWGLSEYTPNFRNRD